MSESIPAASPGAGSAARRAPAVLIPVDCAVNDDHGCTSDRISAIHFPGLELDAVDMRGPTFRELPNRYGEFRIRIGRCEFGARHLRSCVGNIYWERYGMEPSTAVHCLQKLRASRAFTLDGGYEELANWWDSGIDDFEYVRRLLIDAAKDDRLMSQLDYRKAAAGTVEHREALTRLLAEYPENVRAFVTAKFQIDMYPLEWTRGLLADMSTLIRAGEAAAVAAALAQVQAYVQQLRVEAEDSR